MGIDEFDRIERQRASKLKRELFMRVALLFLLFLICGLIYLAFWRSGPETIILYARPGETTSAETLSSSIIDHARIGNNNVSIEGFVVLEDVGRIEYICEDDRIIVQRSERTSPVRDYNPRLWLVNMCDQDVTIEICPISLIPFWNCT